MSALFSPAGYARLDSIVKPGMLCAFDFDGTLSPLVEVPEMAMLPAEIREQLLELSRYAPVAIITGRSIQDVRCRLGFPPYFIVGNHGSEGLPGWETAAERHRVECQGWYEQLTACKQHHACFGPDVTIENKNYSLSIHYRQARDLGETEACLQSAFMQLDPLPRIVTGKFVFNLVPQDAYDKGTALDQLMQISEAKSAIYVGDDVTDEDVFRLHRTDILTVRVECNQETEAEFFLPKWQDIVQLLDELIVRLREQGAKNWTSPVTMSA
jgi:trehalose 6-phosphate phosphatase